MGEDVPCSFTSSGGELSTTPCPSPREGRGQMWVHQRPWRQLEVKNHRYPWRHVCILKTLFFGRKKSTWWLWVFLKDHFLLEIHSEVLIFLGEMIGCPEFALKYSWRKKWAWKVEGRGNKIGKILVVVEMGHGYVELCCIISTFVYLRDFS